MAANPVAARDVHPSRAVFVSNSGVERMTALTLSRRTLQLPQQRPRAFRLLLTAVVFFMGMANSCFTPERTRARLAGRSRRRRARAASAHRRRVRQREGDRRPRLALHRRRHRRRRGHPWLDAAGLHGLEHGP
jgi:hypothetical protein